MPTPLEQAFTAASDYHALTFVIQQLLGGVATHHLVKVVSCTNNGGLAPYGFVDVIPLVSQVAGDGQAVPHGTLYRLPYFRLQGGKNAVIMDPEKGDIGLAAFCSRDISSVKANPQAAVNNPGTPPSSARKFSMADGVYFGGFLNAQPDQYVQFSSTGVTVKSPHKVRVEAPTIELVGDVNQTNGNVTMAQTLDVTGNIHGAATITGDSDVVSGTIHLKTHKHTGVQTGGGTSGGPTP
jgi:hypothetical protein